MTTLTKTNTTLKAVGHKHEAIMQHLIEYPEQKLGEVAAHFEIGQSWLSILIHSHAFQDAFAEYRDKYYGGVADGLEEKLNGLAHLCVDRLSEKMETCDDAAYIASTTDKVLGRLGFGAKGTGNLTVNATGPVQVTQATPAAIHAAEEARKRLQKIKEVQAEVIERGSDAQT